MDNKPKWIDKSPDRTGKRLSNMYWKDSPIWKRDEESFKMTAIDSELTIYHNTIRYYFNGNVIHVEKITTHGSQLVPFKIPTGYKLKDPNFVPGNGKINIEVVKDNYVINIIYNHSTLTNPITVTLNKQYNDVITLDEISRAVTLPANYSIGSRYQHTDYTVVDDHTINVQLTYSIPISVINPDLARKKVTVVFYKLVDGVRQEVDRQVLTNIKLNDFDYTDNGLVVPEGYNIQNTTNIDDNNTAIILEPKVYTITFNFVENKNGTEINRYTATITKPHGSTIERNDLPVLAGLNLTEQDGRLTNKLDLSYPDDIMDIVNGSITQDTTFKVVPNIRRTLTGMPIGVIDPSIVIHHNRTSYIHNGDIISTEETTTRGSAAVPLRLPDGFKLKNPNTPIPNGTASVEIVRNEYIININYIHILLKNHISKRISKKWGET